MYRENKGKQLKEYKVVFRNCRNFARKGLVLARYIENNTNTILIY